jgi:hypothetical protein
MKILRNAFQPALALCLCLLPQLSVSALAQNADDTSTSPQNAEKWSGDYIPEPAIAAAFLSPADVLSSPDWELMPVEVIRAAGMQHVGLDPMHVKRAQLVVGMPTPNGPTGGLVLELTQDYDFSALTPEVVQAFEKADASGMTIWESKMVPTVRIHQPDARTMVIATGGYLEPMLATREGGKGKLAELTSRMSPRPGLTMIVAMQQVRPMVTDMLRQRARQLPPQLQGLTELAELSEAAMVNANYSFTSGSLQVSLLGRDESSAETIEKTLNEALEYGGQVVRKQAQEEIRGENRVEEATLQYIDRLAQWMIQKVRPKRNGRLVRVNLEGSVGTTGMLVGLLLPAVQGAREAARRVNASNNLKQIGLAMHNYHSTYKKLPDRAIRDESGKPLLSWRVAILPFIEQRALYEQFHLDEPWDSPHNRKLIEVMPSVYTDPSVQTQPGHTVFQVPVGEGFLYEDSGERRFRDVTDGLSNTLMVVEAGAEHTVPWTKPEDLDVDPQQPLAKMGRAHAGGFHVLLGDSAVRFISDSIDARIFRALLTRAGNEVINEF